MVVICRQKVSGQSLVLLDLPSEVPSLTVATGVGFSVRIFIPPIFATVETRLTHLLWG